MGTPHDRSEDLEHLTIDLLGREDRLKKLVSELVRRVVQQELNFSGNFLAEKRFRPALLEATGSGSISSPLPMISEIPVF